MPTVTQGCGAEVLLPATRGLLVLLALHAAGLLGQGGSGTVVSAPAETHLPAVPVLPASPVLPVLPCTSCHNGQLVLLLVPMQFQGTWRGLNVAIKVRGGSASAAVLAAVYSPKCCPAAAPLQLPHPALPLPTCADGGLLFVGHGQARHLRAGCAGGCSCRFAIPSQCGEPWSLFSLCLPS
jgi:hypothetical protein